MQIVNFGWAVGWLGDVVLSAYGFFDTLLQSIGAYAYVIGLFSIAMVCCLLLYPLRGQGLGSDKAIPPTTNNNQKRLEG